MWLGVFCFGFGGFAIYLVNLATLWSLDYDALVLVDILEDLDYGALAFD